jgi:NTE family protein
VREPLQPVTSTAGWWARLQTQRATPEPSSARSASRTARPATILTDAFNIAQDRIARSRLAGDPPDLMISPRLAEIGLFEFHRAAETIALGRRATEKLLPDVREVLAAYGARA